MSGKGKSLYIPSLDGLRCFAVLLVVASHLLTALRFGGMVPGSFGVTIFFFLSGFLITTLLRIEQERTGRIHIGHFYLRRALRIFPPMYIILGLSIAFGAWQNAHLAHPIMNWWYVLGQLFHLTNYQIALHENFLVPIAPSTAIYWSLAVEEHFYLVFPWMFIALNRWGGSRRRQAVILLGLCGLVMLWRCWLHFVAGAGKFRLYVASDTRADSILYGCALALWGNPALDETPIRPSTWKFVLLPLGMAGIVVSLLIHGEWFVQTFSYTVQGLSLIPIYVVAVRYPTWGPMNALNWWWARWIGIFSYTIYLFHHPAMMYCNIFLWRWAVPFTVGVLTLTLAVAAGMYFWVERPAGRLRKRLSVTS